MKSEDEIIFYKQLDNYKIKINQNLNPVRMKPFLSFLLVNLEADEDCFGSDYDWTRRVGEDNLIIGGGWVGDVEYLDSIEYKKNLHNPYNNYVNPFFIFDIMNDEGQKFFREYYADDINLLKRRSVNKIAQLKDQLKTAKETEKNLTELWG